MQRRHGIEDSPAAMYHDYLVVNRWQLEPRVARAFCDDAPQIVELLLSLGAEFGPVETAGFESVPRGHPLDGQGEALISLLEKECRAAGVMFVLDNRVEDVLTDSGQVCGVRARGETATAGSVVLAAGGFTRNPELIQRYLGDRMLAGDQPATPSGPGSHGDSVLIGERLGAAVVGRNRAHWVPAPMVPPEVLLVTTEGHRFVDESVDHSIRTAAANYYGHTYYAVFDDTCRRAGAANWLVALDSVFLFNNDDFRPDDTAVSDRLANGSLVYSDTLAGTIAAAGLDSSIAGTVETYNRACAEGRDAQFEKPRAHLVPISAPPFFVLRIQPTYLVATFCGLRIDADARVLNRNEQPIPGLYAAGESAGGVVGEVYTGHGNSLTSALAFGRRAGRTAAANHRG